MMKKFILPNILFFSKFVQEKIICLVQKSLGFVKKKSSLEIKKNDSETIRLWDL